jgi:PAS domain S-box-containing protein
VRSSRLVEDSAWRVSRAEASCHKLLEREVDSMNGLLKTHDEREAPAPKKTHRSSHVVQFYEDDEFLRDSVAQYVGTGLVRGEPVVVIATELHRSALRGQLVASSFDVERAVSTGQLTLLDAAETLATFMVGDRPDWTLFERNVGAVIEKTARLRAGRSVRAYGEMVDLLVTQGKPDAAILLEGMWNELAKSHGFSLLCAYVMGNFLKEDQEELLQRVCNTHTHVMAADGDARLHEIGLLEQRAKALETEVDLRRHLENQLCDAMRALREREEELRDHFENAIEGMHRVGPDGIILWANRAEMDMLGYSSDEYIGRHIADFYVDRSAIDDILGRLSAGESVRDYEAALRSKDGSIRHVLVHSNVLWRDGKFVHTRCFTRDITDRKLAEELAASERERLAEIARELENANRSKDDFLATVSHELRTPLNAILGWVRMLRAGMLTDDKKERALETIERNANAQTQLIEDLLDVSRIISGKLRLDVGPVEVPSVIENAVEGVRPAANAKSISLTHTIDPNAGQICGDADRLQQVVWNLLTNAVKFSPKGASVTVDVRRRDAVVEIAVADNGQGIAPEIADLIFERFRQADASPSRQHGGLGLGLAIVRHLVELHGGNVKVHSDGPGAGSTFTVSLPVASTRLGSVEPPAVGLVDEDSERVCSAALESVQVLVVDDDADARELLAEVLASAGATVWTVRTVAEAIDLVDARQPDVVLSDISMPDDDGYALIAKLRSLPPDRGGRTPAVALTGYARFEDRTKALVAGFNMHVPKPVQPAELIAVLTGLVSLLPKR